jgi:hypothetical protein
MTRAVRLGLMLLASAAVCLGGCSTPLEVAPLDLPARLDAVVANESAFIPSASGRLAPVAPGTVRDDLAGIVGCWAGVLTEEAGVPGRIYYAYEFTADNRFVFQIVQRVSVPADIGSGTADLLITQTGTYTITTSNTVVLRNEEGTATDSVSGETSDLPVAGTEDTALVTLDGDQLLFAQGVDPADPVDPNINRFYVATRIGCQ